MPYDTHVYKYYVFMDNNNYTVTLPNSNILLITTVTVTIVRTNGLGN